MTAVESEVTISEWIGQDANGGAAPDDSLANSESQQVRRQWQAVIDKLLEWLTSPEPIEYEELEPLSCDLLQTAIDFALDAQSAATSLPSAFGPSVDGGISFEWRFGDGSLMHMEVVDIGLTEITLMRAGQVLDHYWLERIPQHRGWLKRDRPAA